MSGGDATIRLMERRDLDGFRAIVDWSARDGVANFQTEPLVPAELEATWEGRRETWPYFVAEVGGAIAGASWASPWKPKQAYAWTAEVSVYVLPSYQGRGLARRLYERLFATLEAQGYRMMLAGIVVPNEASVRLHESFGMRKVGVFEKQGFKHGAWRDVGYWQRGLDGADPPEAPVGVAAALERMDRKG